MRRTIVTDKGQLQNLVAVLLTRPAFAFDVEAQGENRGVAHLMNVSWISFASYGIAFTVPMGHPIGDKVIGRHKEPRADKNGKIRQFWVDDYEPPPEQLDPEFVWETLKPLFADPDIIKIADDITVDVPAVSRFLGFVPVPPYDDPKVTDQLLNENLRKYGLKERTWDLFEIRYDKNNTGRCVEKWPFSMVGRYSVEDSVYTFMRWVWGHPKLEGEGLTKPHEVEKALMSPLIGMRLAGAPVSIPRLEALRDTLKADLVKQEADIYRAAGAVFNINSTRQQQQILYGKGDLVITDATTKKEIRVRGQGLRPWRLTKGGMDKQKAGETPDWSFYSTDDEALKSYEGNAVVDAIRTYRDTSKLLGTYVLSWLGDPESGKESRIHNGRIYTHFKQYGTVTGRLSSAAPNLQNVPRASSEYGKLIRGVVEAPDGEVLVCADYGQIELVILAHLIGYGHLFDGFWKGIDPHTVHAAGVLGKDPADVTKIERQTFGKTLGFTIVNGAGPFKVGQMIGGNMDDGEALLRKYDKDFPETPAFKQAVFELARSRQPVPYVRTLLGRKRRVPELLSSNYKRRAAAERQTFNTLIQGGAADVIKLAMIHADRMLGEECPEAYLSLTVHDEILAVGPEKYGEMIKEILVRAMTGPQIQDLIKVPLTVDANVVKNWADAK